MHISGWKREEQHIAFASFERSAVGIARMAEEERSESREMGLVWELLPVPVFWHLPSRTCPSSNKIMNYENCEFISINRTKGREGKRKREIESGVKVFLLSIISIPTLQLCLLPKPTTVGLSTARLCSPIPVSHGPQSHLPIHIQSGIRSMHPSP